MYYVFLLLVLYALLYLYCLCCCSVLFYKQPFFLHFEISSPIYKNMEFVSILRFPWLFINSISIGIYFIWSWTPILAPCSGTLFILHTHLFWLFYSSLIDRGCLPPFSTQPVLPMEKVQRLGLWFLILSWWAWGISEVHHPLTVYLCMYAV